MSENEWNNLNVSSPEDKQSVLTSVKSGNTFYHEVLYFDYDDKTWKHNDGTPLKDEANVVGWKSTGSTYLG